MEGGGEIIAFEHPEHRKVRYHIEELGNTYLRQKGLTEYAMELTEGNNRTTIEFKLTGPDDIPRAKGDILSELAFSIPNMLGSKLTHYEDDSINSIYESEPVLRYIRK